MHNESIINTHYGAPALLDGEGKALTFQSYKNKVAIEAMNHPALQKLRGQFSEKFLQQCFDRRLKPNAVCELMLP